MMSEELIKRIIELLEKIIEHNSGFNWNILTAIGTCVTPIIAAIISYFLGRKIEKQKQMVSQANIATLDLIKGNLTLTKEDIYNYLQACITVNTKKVAEYFDISIEDAFDYLNKLKCDNMIKLFNHSDNDKDNWIWQIV